MSLTQNAHIRQSLKRSIILKSKSTKTHELYIYCIWTLDCLHILYVILVSPTSSLPCHYQPFIQLPRACQWLAQPAIVLAQWAASLFPYGRLASCMPQGNHTALCEPVFQPQNCRVGPVWGLATETWGQRWERMLLRHCGYTGIHCITLERGRAMGEMYCGKLYYFRLV